MSDVTRKLAREVGRLMLAYLLIFSQGAWAAQHAKTTYTANPAQKTAVEQERENPSLAAGAVKAQTEEVQGEASENPASAGKLPGDGKHEGIKVHGHWAIEVRNPDGTVVTHREFENSLTAGGAAILSSLLSRSVSLGSWTVEVGSSTAPPCQNTSAGVPSACLIHEPGTAFVPDNNSVFTLTVASGAGNTLILSGTAAAGINGNIDQVQTFSSVCANTFAPSSPCSVAAQLPQSAILTSATLTSPIVVSQGQTIAVTVTISFS